MRRMSRRDFLRNTCCSAAAGMAAASFSRLGLMNAMAQNAPDYKALVCVFLFGGNDANNMIVPLDNSGYTNYKTVRASLALPTNQLLSVTPSSVGTPFGFHYRLAELQQLFTNKKLAVLTNVGTLVQPTTRDQIMKRQATVPRNLYSHEDQQAQMQTATLRERSDTGWGGRLVDNMIATYGSGFPMAISLGGNNIFAEGVSIRTIQTSGSPAQPISGFNGSTEDNARLSALQNLLTFDTGLTLIQSASSTTKTALQDGKTLADALASGTKLATAFPTGSYLSSQLQQVAQIMQVRAALGLKRQVFFVNTGGFDTHSSQLAAHERLYTDVSKSLSAFYNATAEMGLASQVTAFTMSDFGRTFLPDSDLGTDHAWGNHQMILGGAVKGNDFYGTFPTLVPNGPDDATSEGRWIPTTSLDQYGATLAQWFGVQPGDLSTIFPNLPNFQKTTLNFI